MNSHASAVEELQASAQAKARAEASVMGAICAWDPNAIVWLAHQSRPYSFGVIPNPIGALAGFEISKHTLHCDVVMVAGNYHVKNDALKQFALATIKEFHLQLTADPGGILCLVPKTFV